MRLRSSKDVGGWSPGRTFLVEAARLPWNGQRRVIDPSFVIDGDTLHCFFVGSAVHKDADGKSIRANLMGHAVTRDPQLQQWEILTRDRPLIGASERAPDGVENTMIFRTGTEWTMIYSEGLAAGTPLGLAALERSPRLETARPTPDPKAEMELAEVRGTFRMA